MNEPKLTFNVCLEGVRMDIEIQIPESQVLDRVTIALDTILVTQQGTGSRDYQDTCMPMHYDIVMHMCTIFN